MERLSYNKMVDNIETKKCYQNCQYGFFTKSSFDYNRYANWRQIWRAISIRKNTTTNASPNWVWVHYLNCCSVGRPPAWWFMLEWFICKSSQHPLDIMCICVVNPYY